MTRARQELHLVAPLKFYVTQQPRTGDRHVYGARSRFFTQPVMDVLEASAWPTQPRGDASPGAAAGARIDVAEAMRAMWSR